MSSAVESKLTLANAKKTAQWGAYWELTKPRIATMVLITIVTGAWVADPHQIHWTTLFHVAWGMFLVAASGNASNMYLERYSDFLMPRTAKRPLPDQRLSATQVTYFASITLGSGIGYLLLTTNLATTLCAAITWLLYVFVYTPMKRYSPWNTEVGAVAGALPVLSGALAATGGVEWLSGGLFLTLLFWQFPHFMAIAWIYRHQYREGGLQMLTVTEPTGRAAGRKAVTMALVTWAVSLLPAVKAAGVVWGISFVVLATLLAGWYWQTARRFAQEPTEGTARKLLRVSVAYLPLYMLVLVVFSRFV